MIYSISHPLEFTMFLITFMIDSILMSADPRDDLGGMDVARKVCAVPLLYSI